MDKSSQLLTLFIDKEMEADVVDCLIQLDGVNGFTVSKSFGFSSESAHLNKAEQVAGGRHMLKVEIIHNSNCAHVALESLAGLNSRNPLRYIITPIIESGHLIS
jgi:hypothetical protein